MNNQQTKKDCVGVIEDDSAVQKALCLMLESLGIEVLAYSSAREYLDDAVGRSRCTCLVLDVRLPGMSGIELQHQLMKQSLAPAIVFISGHADVPMAVEVMRNGAVDLLQKPFREQQLLDSVQKALEQAKSTHAAENRAKVSDARLACLTPREKQVLAGMLKGSRSKEIASGLGLAARTVEEHRANVMNKMHATSIADLIRMCIPTP